MGKHIYIFDQNHHGEYFRPLLIDNFRMDDETDLSLPADIYNFKECTSIFSMISTLNIASMTSTTFQKCISNYQRFLSTFPWLYVYWDKYATFVWSGKGDLDLVRKIYFEALSKKCLFYSVDMWICCM